MTDPDERETLLLRLRQFPLHVAHDLRGTLAGVTLLAQVAQQHLQRGDLAAAEQDLQRIAEHAQMSQLVLDALWRMADPLERPPKPRVCALDKVARTAADEAVLSLQAHLPGRHLPRLHLEPLGKASVDQGLMHVILVNLVSNALKFNLDRDGVNVSVSRDAASEAANLVLIVSDDGVGFEMDAANIGPSQRSSHAGPVPGYGLGLSIVRQALERLGGALELRSAPGRGTSARVTIPAASA